jgi:thioredoxin-like negative regulator of GroEL
MQSESCQVRICAKKPQPAPGLNKDTTEASFLADVIEASQTLPVIVDVFPLFLGANRKPPPPSRGHALENASLFV